MNIFKNIIALVAAFHLVFATSGVTLVYMFCGEQFCSLEVAKSLDDVHPTMHNTCSTEEDKSCCASEEESQDESPCRTELHTVRLSVDAMYAFTQPAFAHTQALIAVLSTQINAPQPAQIRALDITFLDKPPPQSIKRTILYRSLLI
jgi:hypothetical protein